MPSHASQTLKKTYPLCATSAKLRSKAKKEGWRRSKKPTCVECQLRLELIRLQRIVYRRQQPPQTDNKPSPRTSPGWVRIGRKDSTGRRSLWMRTRDTSHGPIELAAGREGDDDYVLIDESNPQYLQIYGVLTSALYATTC